MALIIIGALFGDDQEDETAERPAASTIEATTAAPTTSEAPAPEPTPPAEEPEPEPEPADTGRMSDGEFTSAQNALARVDEELNDYTGRVSERCSLMIRAGQVAEALDCIDEAFDGVEGNIGAAYSFFDDVRDDVGRACLRNVTRVRNILNVPLYRAAVNSKRALSSLDSTAIRSSTANLAR